VIAAVANDPLALAFANLNQVDARVKHVGVVMPYDPHVWMGNPGDIASVHYPLDRHLLIYVPRHKTGTIEQPAKAFLDFVLSCEGQLIIASGNLGYTPLNAAEIRRERNKLHVGDIH
jgi:ABC-type phosphate transport system substrate-binding protein